MEKPQGLRPINTLSSSPGLQHSNGVHLGRRALPARHEPATTSRSKPPSVGSSSLEEIPKPEKAKGLPYHSRPAKIPRRKRRLPGSSEDEDELARITEQSPISQRTVHLVSPKRRRIAGGRNLLEEFVPSSLKALDDRMNSNEYPVWRAQQGNQNSLVEWRPNSRAFSSDPDHLSDMVSTRSLGLSKAMELASLKGGKPEPEVQVQNSQPISVSSDRSSPHTQRRQHVLRTLHDQPMEAPGPLEAALEQATIWDDGQTEARSLRSSPRDSRLHSSPQGTTVDLTNHNAPGQINSAAQANPRQRKDPHFCAIDYLLVDGQEISLENLTLVVNKQQRFLKAVGNGKVYHKIDQRATKWICHSKLGEGRIFRICEVQDSVTKDREAITHIVLRDDKGFAAILTFLTEQDFGKLIQQPDGHMQGALSKAMDAVSIHHEGYDDAIALSYLQNRIRSDYQAEVPQRSERKATRLSRQLRDASGSFMELNPATELRSSTSRPRRPPRSTADVDSDIEKQRAEISAWGVQTRRSSSRKAAVADPLHPEHAHEATPAIPFSKNPGLGMRWKKPLIFPAKGKRKATVDFEDLVRLDEGEFLNDSLIQFYLRYLQDSIERDCPETAKRVYWFNSYFYATLTTGTKTKNGTNFEAVRRWTKQVNLFDFDFVVVPINEHAHWYLAILCNLPTLVQENQKSVEQSADATTLDCNQLEDEDVQLVGQDQGQVLHVRNAEDVEFLGASAPISPGHAQVRSSVQVASSDHKRPAGSPPLIHTDIDITSPPATPLGKEHMDRKWNQVELECIAQANHEDGSSRQLRITKGAPQVDDQAKLSSQDVGIVEEGTIPHLSPRRAKRRPPVRTYDPCTSAIIVLDSLGGPHAVAVRALKTYLVEEAKDKLGSAPFSEADIRGMNAKGIPQQQNFCDCGLFLLGYMDKFVEDPRKFVTKLLRKEYDETHDWPRLRPSEMRHNMRKLLFQLHKADVEAKKEKRLRVSDSISMRSSNSVPQREIPTAAKTGPLAVPPLTVQQQDSTHTEVQAAVANTGSSELKRVSSDDGLQTTSDNSKRIGPGPTGTVPRRQNDGDEMILDTQEEMAAAAGAVEASELALSDDEGREARMQLQAAMEVAEPRHEVIDLDTQ